MSRVRRSRLRTGMRLRQQVRTRRRCRTTCSQLSLRALVQRTALLVELNEARENVGGVDVTGLGADVGCCLFADLRKFRQKSALGISGRHAITNGMVRRFYRAN